VNEHQCTRVNPKITCTIIVCGLRRMGMLVEMDTLCCSVHMCARVVVVRVNTHLRLLLFLLAVNIHRAVAHDHV